MGHFPPSLNSDIGHWETPASWGFGPFYVTVRSLNGFSYLMTGFRKQVRRAVLPHPVFREKQAVTEVHLYPRARQGLPTVGPGVTGQIAGTPESKRPTQGRPHARCRPVSSHSLVKYCFDLRPVLVHPCIRVSIFLSLILIFPNQLRQLDINYVSALFF